jgi:hypothetical protein
VSPADPIVLATRLAWPEPRPSDQCLAEALTARGHEVESVPWNGPFERFAHAAAVVIRATWDYHTALDRYREWLARLDPARTLAEPRASADALRRLGSTDAVLKPMIGASGFGVERVSAGDEAAALERLRAVKPGDGPLLVQEFVLEISEGELAGVFFDGAFSLTG